MQDAMNWLAERRGVGVVRMVIPEPASRHLSQERTAGEVGLEVLEHQPAHG